MLRTTRSTLFTGTVLHWQQWLGLLLLLPIAWLITTLPALWVAIGVAGVLVLPWLLQAPWLILLAMPVVLPISSSIKLGPLSGSDGLLALVVALWFADGVRRRHVALRVRPITIALVLYAGILYVSLLTAVNVREAGIEVLKWLEMVAVLLIVPSVLPHNRLIWLVAALVLGGVIQAGFGIYQFVFRVGPEWFTLMGGFMRAYGTFSQPNPYGGYLGLTLPVAASLAFYGWSQFSQRMFRWFLGAETTDVLEHSIDKGVYTIGNKMRLRWVLVTTLFYSGAAGLMALALLASWSRGAWLGAALALLAVAMLYSRRAAIATIIGGISLLALILLSEIGVAFIPDLVTQRLADMGSYIGLTNVLDQPLTAENYAVHERLAHWVAAIRMWQQSPLLGVGPGNYETVYPSVRLAQWVEPLGHAHNIYLNVLAETGVIGLLAFLLLWIMIVAWLFRHYRRVKRLGATGSLARVVGVIGVVVHLSIHNLFDNLFVQGMYLHLGLWLAVILSDEPTGERD